MFTQANRNAQPTEAELAQLEQESVARVLSNNGALLEPEPAFVRQLDLRLQHLVMQPEKTSSRRLFGMRVFRPAAALLMVVLAVTAGLVWFTPMQKVDAAEILDRAVQTANGSTAGGLQTYRSSRLIRQPAKNGSGFIELREDIYGQLPNKMRIEGYMDMNGTPTSGPDTIIIGNGSQSWLYDPIRKEATLTGKPFGKEQAYNASDLQNLLDQVNHNHFFTVTLAGTEQIAGRAAYLLVLKPDPNTTDPKAKMIGQVRMWIDTQTYLPLGQEDDDTTGAQISSWRTTSIQINPALDPSLFNFTPPPGTKILEEEIKENKSDTQKPVPSGGKSDNGKAIPPGK